MNTSPALRVARGIGYTLAHFASRQLPSWRRDDHLNSYLVFIDDQTTPQEALQQGLGALWSLPEMCKNAYDTPSVLQGVMVEGFARVAGAVNRADIHLAKKSRFTKALVFLLMAGVAYLAGSNFMWLLVQLILTPWVNDWQGYFHNISMNTLRFLFFTFLMLMYFRCLTYQPSPYLFGKMDQLFRKGPPLGHQWLEKPMEVIGGIALQAHIAVFRYVTLNDSETVKRRIEELFQKKP